jgi:ankyrin repeat protein
MRLKLVAWAFVATSLALAGCSSSAGVEWDQPTELPSAIVTGSEDEVTRLLADGADPNDSGGGSTSPISLAVQYGEVEIAAALLAAGARVDEPGLLVTVAKTRGDDRVSEQLVRLLVAGGADPCSTFGSGPQSGQRASEVASDLGKSGLADLLVEIESGCAE